MKKTIFSPSLFKKSPTLPAQKPAAPSSPRKFKKPIPVGKKEITEQVKVEKEDLSHLTLYLSNLSYTRDFKGIRDLVTPYGEVKKIRILMDYTTNRSKGMAFVQLETEDQVQEAIKGLNQKQIDGRMLKASKAIPQEKKPLAPGAKPFIKKYATNNKRSVKKPALF